MALALFAFIFYREMTLFVFYYKVIYCENRKQFLGQYPTILKVEKNQHLFPELEPERTIETVLAIYHSTTRAVDPFELFFAIY